MSRAYRLLVTESLQRVIRAKDSISTQLELLGILPPEEMAALLRWELQRRGFTESEGQLTRQDGPITTTVDPATGQLTVRAEVHKELDLQTTRDGIGYDDFGPTDDQIRTKLRTDAQQSLEMEAQREEIATQKEATRELEGALADVRKELHQAVNRVTAEALKRKAAQLGRIQEIREDPESGSLTIRVEV